MSIRACEAFHVARSDSPLPVLSVRCGVFSYESISEDFNKILCYFNKPILFPEKNISTSTGSDSS